jgi:hypothetical protein
VRLRRLAALLVCVSFALLAISPLAISASAADAEEEPNALVDGSAWAQYLERLGEAGELLNDPAILRTPTMRAHGYRNLLRLMSAAHEMTLEYSSSDRPTLSRIYDVGRKFADDNPNTFYQIFRARPGAQYRVWGQVRETADPPRFVIANVRVQGGAGLPGAGPTIHSAGGGLVIDPDGSLEIQVGGPRREHNWLPLDPVAPLQSVAIRQTFYDWDRERPIELRLERLDAPGDAPVLTAEGFERALDAIGRFVVFHARKWPAYTAELARSPNQLAAPARADEIAGVPGQRYAHAHFRVAPDEALVVEFEPPDDCYVWSLHADSFFEESLDFANRLVSVNGHQAYVDPDGRFRAVLAHSDPGTPNWIDIGEGEAHEEGLISLRFQECSRKDAYPAPATRLVKLPELRDSLPASHPRVSAEERAAEIARRRRHVLDRLGR